MAYIQLVEIRTSDVDKVSALEGEWEAATEGKRTVRRSYLTRDRNDPDRYVVVVLFDSYEDAMRNSQLPETQAFAEKLVGVLGGPPTFHDLDVLEERT
jgi:hypothetical protein